MLGSHLASHDYLQRFVAELNRVDRQELEEWSDLLFQAWQEDRFVFICGNGGSGTTATHMCEDLCKGTVRTDDLHDDSKKRIKTLSLTDNVGWILAVGNDCGYEHIFVQQLMQFASEGDVCIAISGSGNSPNIIAAVEWANRRGLTTFGLTGFDGGRLRKCASLGLHVPVDDMGLVESIHLALFHWVLDDLYARINHEGRYRRQAAGTNS